MCALTTVLFLGGWLPPFDVWFLNWIPGTFWFVLKMLLIFFAMAMVRAPISLFMVFATALVLQITGWVAA